MLFTNYELKNETQFKMEGKDFNTLVNSLVKTPTETHNKPVKIGLVTRTIQTNLVAQYGDTVIPIVDHVDCEAKGYFQIINSIQHHVIKTHGEINFSEIKKTVLMPIGAFEYEGEIVIYVQLIIQDEQLDTFNTNPSITFKAINELTLNNLDNRSIMIIPTLTVVS